MRHFRAAVLIVLSAAFGVPAAAQEFALENVPSVTAVPVGDLKARTVIFAGPREDRLADSATGLLPFEAWARERPIERRYLSLFPDFAEPVLRGATKRRLSMYIAEARFKLAKPARAIDLSRYANIGFFERIDPAVKHREIAAAEAVPNKETEAAARPPNRKWCEDAKACIASRYKFEGKIPTGILLVNKLRDENKTPIPDFIEFQSEIRLPSPQASEISDIADLTRVNSPVTGVLQQNIFWVNQVMQFGKLVAVLQQHPAEPNAAVATVYLVLAVRDDVLNKQRDYGNAPILRNLVPAQLLMGRSSFNTGNSISAGLPNYARSRIKAIAGIMEQE